MAAVPTKAIRRALFAKLDNSASLEAIVGDRIYHSVAPSNASFPFVVFFKSSGTPTYAFGATAFDSQVWTVKTVDRDGSSDRAEDAAAVIDSLLSNGSLSITGAEAMDVRRLSDVDYTETDDGQTYRHSGATFRVIAQ